MTSTKSIQLSDFQNKPVHFIGIGGCSMSGLAQIMHDLGYVVSGSDQNQSNFTDILVKKGIPVFIGHDAANIDNKALIIYSAAIKPTNVEFARAAELHLPMLERSVLLGKLSEGYEKTVCVAGCHGKTTITSMLALIMKDTEINPTIHVGGEVDFLSGGVHVGSKQVFITEACEYVRSFLTLHPTHIILNNIDDDHLDYYKDIEEIKDTFVDFLNLLPADGIVFANTDDLNTREVLTRANKQVVSYSLTGGSDYTAEQITFDEMGSGSFDLCYKGENLGRIALQVPGMHNVQNALAAAAFCYHVFQISVPNIAEALLSYRLVGRRFERIGEREGVQIFHDYAHHPTEIKACLAAAKQYPHNTLYVLFQCNSFTRARTLKEKYAFSFEDADVVMMPDIYPGRDVDLGDIHATDIIAGINAHSNNCLYLPTFTDIKEYLLAHWKPGDMVITLGSGDVNRQQLILLEE
ncbi:MAG: UDP-N-acetylmuramate--L-alanine ligase [Christensenellaceae bacterium]|jgi:UDP-N-acetylmuramate--alanine ligase